MKENTGISKYVMLGMLVRMPQVGYTIKEWIENEYSHFRQESFGQICPTLKKLVAEGLAVNSDRIQPGNGRGQTICSVTNTGRKELSDWLRKEPEIEKLRYEILLKISSGQNTEPEVLLGHLDSSIGRNEKLVKDMNGYVEPFKELKEREVDCFYNQLTVLCGVHIYSAMKGWAVEARKIISERGADF